MTRLAFCDIETTGLDPRRDHILEVVFVITDASLNELGATVMTVHQPQVNLFRMSPYVGRMHMETGLLRRVAVADEQANVERRLLDFVRELTPYGTKLAGNSIGFDMSFLAQHMPRLRAHFHYRCVDVSSLKTLAEMWNYPLYDKPTDGVHTALFDTRQSIEELKFYRRTLIKQWQLT